MHLTPREIDKLLILSAGELARNRRARGLSLVRCGNRVTAGLSRGSRAGQALVYEDLEEGDPHPEAIAAAADHPSAVSCA